MGSGPSASGELFSVQTNGDEIWIQNSYKTDIQVVADRMYGPDVERKGAERIRKSAMLTKSVGTEDRDNLIVDSRNENHTWVYRFQTHPVVAPSRGNKWKPEVITMRYVAGETYWTHPCPRIEVTQPLRETPIPGSNPSLEELAASTCKFKRNCQIVAKKTRDTAETLDQWREYLQDTHRPAVLVSKGVSAGATVVGAVMLFFPPTMIAGAVTMIGGAVVGGGAAVGDVSVNTSNSTSAQKESEAFTKSLWDLEDEAEVLSDEIATFAQTNKVTVDGASWLISKEIVTGGLRVAGGILELTNLVPKTMQITEFAGTAMTAGTGGGGLGVSATQGIAITGEALEGGLVAGTSTVSRTAALSGAQLAGKVLGVAAAVVSVGDLVYSIGWQGNPTADGIRDLAKAMQEKADEIEENAEKMIAAESRS